MKKFKLIAIGGTFDHLHKGHRWILHEAFKSGEKVIVGLTSDKYAEEKFKEKSVLRQSLGQPLRLRSVQAEYKVNFKVQSYKERKEELEAFLRQAKLLDRAEIIEIHDVYGGAEKNQELEAIAVTRDSLAGAREINKRRKDLGLSKLMVIRLPLVTAEDGKRISSDRIRSGETDREGKLYRRRAFIKGKISSALRLKLKKPLGQLFKHGENDREGIYKLIKLRIHHSGIVITVGDIVTKNCIAHGIAPAIAIYDYRVQRKQQFAHDEELGIPSFNSDIMRKAYVGNPAGCVTEALSEAIFGAIHTYLSTGKFYVIKIDGEDDLAAIPSILLSPLGSTVLYGQPNKGVVMVTVTEKVKGRVAELIRH